MILGKVLKKIADKGSEGHSLYFGTVISADDPSRNGFLYVHIPELTGPDKSAQNLFQCIWTSPFAGATPMSNVDDKNAPVSNKLRIGETIRNTVVVVMSGWWCHCGCLFHTVENGTHSSKPRRVIETYNSNIKI